MTRSKRDIPAYEAIYRAVKEQIVSGAYLSGDRLPSKRTLSEKWGVSVITAEHAYELLIREGYAESRERCGYFVTYLPGEFFVSAEVTERPPINRTQTAAPSDGISFDIIQKKVRRILSEYGQVLTEKTPSEGSEVLRRAISDYLLRSRGMIAPYDRIMIGSGAEYLYGVLVKVLGRDRIFAIEDPSYEQIASVYLGEGVTIRRLPLGQDGISSSALISTDADVLHVTPYRSYPTGVTASASKRHEYARFAMGGGIVIEDDFESEFSLSGRARDTLYSEDTSGRVIYVNTFSRTVGSGIRVGYCVLPECLMESYRNNAGYLSCTVPTLEQYLLARLIDDGDLERHINRVRRQLRKKEKDRLPEEEPTFKDQKNKKL